MLTKLNFTNIAILILVAVLLCSCKPQQTEQTKEPPAAKQPEVTQQPKTIEQDTIEHELIDDCFNPEGNRHYYFVWVDTVKYPDISFEDIKALGAKHFKETNTKDTEGHTVDHYYLNDKFSHEMFEQYCQEPGKYLREIKNRMVGSCVFKVSPEAIGSSCGYENKWKENANK